MKGKIASTVAVRSQSCTWREFGIHDLMTLCISTMLFCSIMVLAGLSVLHLVG
ncbi:MAG: hypothetical protein KIT82_20495 [Bradyrhizobium sp.]|nr:hypothetical protein [Bradyrhizobium sp.]